ncbi:MAG TPA: alpha-glucuronidase family glycosyl hydrolase [Puia sp.]|nr:alpha-glucuronidase family glycosyl hydrolase [Puia sp.]
MNKQVLTFLLLIFGFYCSRGEDGYRLWLRYDRIDNPTLLQQYRDNITCYDIKTTSSLLSTAKEELLTGLQGLLGKGIPEAQQEGCLFAGTPASSPLIQSLHLEQDLASVGKEGYIIRSIHYKDKHGIVIAAGKDIGVLYGVFHFLRLLQTHRDIRQLSMQEAPALSYRILDHWDNLNRTVERGYAGMSIWNWWTLPGYIDPRYKDYARANASIGINGAVLNNVNASPLMLTGDYLIKVRALANLFRSYGIKVYLSVKFSAPIEIGGLKTADPLDPEVQQWWRQKAGEIYRLIPDFGGFLVKANSEGQPGPQNYGRTHADGANLLADALAPHKGIVIWRAFVYSATPDDRAGQAYNEFKPLDGKFRSNVLLQVKNGPIDFQPREPFHPLFGAMPRTPMMVEFQLTQEYLGFSTHLVYLAPLFKECLDADTYTGLHPAGKGAPVASTISGMAGVANIGNDINWCGHPFAQANWYAFGRLAWGAETAGAGSASPSSGQIAEEWIRQTFTNDATVLQTIKEMMLASREIAVDYMTPLGLHHIMGYDHHYGPAPWYDKASRPDWNPVYYHQADTAGIGFDRTVTGSNVLQQYAPGARLLWEDARNCPDAWLLWWHHVPWDHRMQSGRTLWEELCHKYDTGVDSVRWMQKTWDRLKETVDKERWEQVQMLLAIQANEALWWRNACLLYFQTFSRKPLPAGANQPDHNLPYYENLKFNYAPGTSQ